MKERNSVEGGKGCTHSLNETSRSAELEITASGHSSRLDEAVCSHALEAKVQQSSII